MSSSPTRPSVERIRRATHVDEAIVLMSRASHDSQLCKRLLEGHRRVLEAYGIKNLSSFRTDWFRRDDVWIIAVLTPDGERVLAGARLQPGLVANDFPLHQAVGHVDPNVGTFLEQIIPDKAYELNALWNSIELAGMGMGWSGRHSGWRAILGAFQLNLGCQCAEFREKFLEHNGLFWGPITKCNA